MNQMFFPYTLPTDSQSLLAITMNTSQMFAFSVDDANVTLDRWYALRLENPVGVYTLTAFGIGDVDRGQATVYLDGAVVGVLDFYVGVPTYNYVQSVSFTISAPGQHILQIKVADKNDASSGYKFPVSLFVIS